MRLCFWCSFLSALCSILEAKLLRWGHVHKPLRFASWFLAQLRKSFLFLGVGSRRSQQCLLNVHYCRCRLCLPSSCLPSNQRRAILCPYQGCVFKYLSEFKMKPKNTYLRRFLLMSENPLIPPL